MNGVSVMAYVPGETDDAENVTSPALSFAFDGGI